MQKVLVTGGAGQIGSRVVQQAAEIFPSDCTFYFLEHSRHVQIPDSLSGRAYTQSSLPSERAYDFAFHLAANIHTKYSDLPEHRERFIEDNVNLTRRVCDASRRVLLVSSDNVFSGKDIKDSRETDTPQPCNFYGQTKADAERVVLDQEGTVIRIQTMLGVPRNLIVDRVLAAIDGKDYLPFWDDTFGRPTYFEDFAGVVSRVFDSGKQGIYHVSCEGEPISRAEIARKVLEIHFKNGLPVARKEISYAKCDIPFPRRLALDTTATRSDLGIEKFASIDDALLNHVLAVRNRA